MPDSGQDTWLAPCRNLGGKTTLNMAELREILAKAGHEGVTTYAQSGNGVLDGDDSDPVRVSVEGAILDH